MSGIFYWCSSISLPDISKWNTINVTDMSYIFYNCRALSFLPDISKWNTNNVANMNEIKYFSLNLLPFTYLYKFNKLLVYEKNKYC